MNIIDLVMLTLVIIAAFLQISLKEIVIFALKLTSGDSDWKNQTGII